MCGPTGQEVGLEQQQGKFSQTVQADYATRFAQQQQTLASLGDIVKGVEAGRLSPGLDAKTLAAMNTNILDTTGANYANAARAINMQLAGRTGIPGVGMGGESGLESGVDKQIKAGIASAAAGQTSTEQFNLTLADRQAAERNTQMAMGGLQAIAGEQAPLGFAGAATEANKTAFSEADTIAQQQSQEQAAIGGGVASLAMGGLTFGAGMMGGGGLKGGLKALSGTA